METYETNTLDLIQKTEFLVWFDRVIGTDREVNSIMPGQYVVMCFELEPDEVTKCRAYETHLSTHITFVH